MVVTPPGPTACVATSSVWEGVAASRFSSRQLSPSRYTKCSHFIVELGRTNLLLLIDSSLLFHSGTDAAPASGVAGKVRAAVVMLCRFGCAAQLLPASVLWTTPASPAQREVQWQG